MVIEINNTTKQFTANGPMGELVGSGELLFFDWLTIQSISCLEWNSFSRTIYLMGDDDYDTSGEELWVHINEHGSEVSNQMMQELIDHAVEIDEFFRRETGEGYTLIIDGLVVYGAERSEEAPW